MLPPPPPRIPPPPPLPHPGTRKHVPVLLTTLSLAATLALTPPADAKRLDPVNNPALLPSEPNVTVIDVAGFLSSGQENRLMKKIQAIEQDTGIRLRLLAQNYPDTPGLAIKDYWGVDDSTVVLVADTYLSGNMLNFNVGESVDVVVPRGFWQRVSNTFGNKFFWTENGLDRAIEKAVDAIDWCVREEEGRGKCSVVYDAKDEELPLSRAVPFS